MPMVATSDAGSQYSCGRVGRGIQPPASPQPYPVHSCHAFTHPHTHNNNCSFIIARVSRFQLERGRLTDGPTGQRTKRTKPLIDLRVRTRPQLKMRRSEKVHKPRQTKRLSYRNRKGIRNGERTIFFFSKVAFPLAL